jgi:hypothetical protein
MSHAQLRFAQKYIHVPAELLLIYSDSRIFHIPCTSNSEYCTFFLTCLVLPTLFSQEHETPSLGIKAFMCTYNGLSSSRYHLACGNKILLHLDIDMNEDAT